MRVLYWSVNVGFDVVFDVVINIYGQCEWTYVLEAKLVLSAYYIVNVDVINLLYVENCPDLGDSTC